MGLSSLKNIKKEENEEKWTEPKRSVYTLNNTKIGVLEWGEKEKGAERTFNEIMAKTLLFWWKTLIYIQEDQWLPGRINSQIHI